MRPIALLWLALLLLSRLPAAGARPIVAVLAQNDGTEVTDFLVPYGVIASAGVAEVVAVSTGPGPVELWPGLTVRADATVESFDRAHPDGAAFVVVPAFHDSSNAATRSWLRDQAVKGATLVSICDGALALAGTGLLDGHRATGHFASAGRRQREFPSVDWVGDARYVHDGKFISSSGVSASLPTALYVVELLGGRARALEVARGYGLADYGAAHDSASFHVGVGDYWLGARNMIFGWPRDVYALELTPGVDEVGLAFAADMLSRTYFSNAVAVATSDEVATRHGLHVLRGAAPEALPGRALAVRIDDAPAPDGVAIREGARAPDDLLALLARRYGERLATFVAMQLEYPAAPAD